MNRIVRKEQRSMAAVHPTLNTYIMPGNDCQRPSLLSSVIGEYDFAYGGVHELMLLEMGSVAYT